MRGRRLAECECICMLRVSHCAHFIFHSRHSFPLPFDTPFVDVQRKLVRNESVLGFATGLLLLLLALSPSPTASLSLGVLRFCCPFLYYFLSVFFSVLWQLRKFCATAIFVYCVKAAARNALPSKDHSEGSTNCEWQTTVRSEHLGNKHKYERAPCCIYNSEWHSTTS